MADMFSKTENLIDESINCFNLSLAGDPDQEDLWIKYAEYMIKQGDVPAAIDKYGHVPEKDRNGQVSPMRPF